MGEQGFLLVFCFVLKEIKWLVRVATCFISQAPTPKDTSSVERFNVIPPKRTFVFPLS